MSEKTLMELHDLYDQLAEELTAAQSIHTEALNQYKCLKDIYKIKFAQIVGMQRGDKMNQRETAALLTLEWNDWLKIYQKFRYDKDKAELNVKRIEREWTNCMMRISSIKKEMTTFSFAGGNK